MTDTDAGRHDGTEGNRTGTDGPDERAYMLTLFRDRAAATKQEAVGTLTTLARLITEQSAASKDALPLLALAKFGENRTDRGSLRHNKNVLALTGIAADYDGEKVEIDEAVAKLTKAGITAVIYSSPSNAPGKPRWRALCPFSADLPADVHQHLVSRLNGVLGGILVGESWTLSQAYYYGSVDNSPDHRVEIVEGGRLLDQADDLDEGAIGKPQNKSNGKGAPNGSADDYDSEAKFGEKPQAEIGDIIAALEAIPNGAAEAENDWGDWYNRIGMAAYRASGGSQEGFAVFDKWAAKSPKYHGADVHERWANYRNSPPDSVGFGTLAQIARQFDPQWRAPSWARRGVSLEDFYAYLPAHLYIFVPTGAMWPGISVNTQLPPVVLKMPDGMPKIDAKGKPVTIPAAAWLDQNRAVQQMTWAPGQPQLLRDRLIVAEGGWIAKPGTACFNLYRPPMIKLGDAAAAGPWVEHVRLIYPEDAERIIDWLAHRVQHPEQKINHALVLGGEQGIGKDTLLEPVKSAIGPWNFQEASPAQILGRFNGFLKSVILRVSEARDLGEFNRFQFYDHMKTYTAAPPDVLRVDEKHKGEYAIVNVCGVIITTNHKNDGIYLPADDRRHYVVWSNMTKDDFPADYWQRIYGWYGKGGTEHVAAFWAARDLSGFDAKAPPPKTAAFWAIVDCNRPAEEAELADVFDRLKWPNAVTLEMMRLDAPDALAEWLEDRKNRRIIPHRLEQCGYVLVRNPDATDGLWKIKGRRQAVYAKKDLGMPEQISAARAVVG